MSCDEDPSLSTHSGEESIDELVARIAELETISNSELEFMCICVRRAPVRSFRKFSKRFSALPDPLCDVLLLIESCTAEKSPTLSEAMKHFLVKFSEWKVGHAVGEPELPEELKARALSVVTKFHMSLLPIMDDIYDLRSAKELCITYIRDLISDCRYCDAASCMLRFGLCSEFSEVEIALPLVLLHEQKLAFSYLEGDIVKQANLISMIDAHLYPKGKFTNFVKRYRPLKTKKPEFAVANAERFLKAAVKYFNLNVSEVAPNFEYRCLVRGIHYFIRLRYTAMELPGVCFSELMDDLLSRHPSFGALAVSEISKMGDHYEVNRICRSFGIPLPDATRRLLGRGAYGSQCIQLCTPLILSQDSPVSNCLRLPRSVNLRFVRNAEQFKWAVEHAKRARLAALDTEWAPSIGFNSGETIAALLQMAVGNAVYLIEIDQLLRNSLKEEIRQTFEDLFCAMPILKIGYDFSNQDMKALIGALPFCASVFSRTCNLVCIRHHALSVIKSAFGLNCPEKFSSLYGDQKGNCGLKKLCEVVLGVDLDKRQRLSNWKRRPLRPEQVQYAALDVYCLLLIYRELPNLTAT